MRITAAAPVVCATMAVAVAIALPRLAPAADPLPADATAIPHPGADQPDRPSPGSVGTLDLDGPSADPTVVPGDPPHPDDFASPTGARAGLPSNEQPHAAQCELEGDDGYLSEVEEDADVDDENAADPERIVQSSLQAQPASTSMDDSVSHDSGVDDSDVAWLRAVFHSGTHHDALPSTVDERETKHDGAPEEDHPPDVRNNDEDAREQHPPSATSGDDLHGQRKPVHEGQDAPANVTPGPGPERQADPEGTVWQLRVLFQNEVHDVFIPAGMTTEIVQALIFSATGVDPDRQAFNTDLSVAVQPGFAGVLELTIADPAGHPDEEHKAVDTWSLAISYDGDMLVFEIGEDAEEETIREMVQALTNIPVHAQVFVPPLSDAMRPTFDDVVRLSHAALSGSTLDDDVIMVDEEGNLTPESVLKVSGLGMYCGQHADDRRV